MEHRKVRMSKLLLKEALIEELREKKISQVTVSSLCERADLNRSTFYAHYMDLFQLIDEMEDDFLQRVPFPDFSMSRKVVLQKIVDFVEYVKDNRDVYLCLVDNGKVVDRFIVLSQKHNEKLGMIVDASDEKWQKRNLLTVFMVTGYVMTLKEWLSTGAILSVKDVAALLCEFYYNAVGQI